MKLIITTDDHSYTVEKRASDDLAYASTARRHGWSQNIQEEQLTYLYFVAYTAAKREGHIEEGAGLESWSETVINVELSEEDSGPAPF